MRPCGLSRLGIPLHRRDAQCSGRAVLFSSSSAGRFASLRIEWAVEENITMSQNELDTTDGSRRRGVSTADQLGGRLTVFVTEEELMDSGHELPEGYTCPLCCLPIALPAAKHSLLETCCMKRICKGCVVASRQRGMGNVCAFCRTPTPGSGAATLAQVRKRVDAKDPSAIDYLAHAYYDGDYGLQQDIPRSIELWT